MSRKVRHIILIISLWCIAGMAQPPVTISGSAPFAAGEEIRLLVFHDLLNGIPTVATTDIIDKNGHFTLKYHTNEILMAQLAIRTSKAEFFITPSNSYSFTISMDSVLYERIDPEKYGGFLQIENAKTDTGDLNYKINRFSQFFTRVSDAYAYPMIYGAAYNVFDTVRDIISRRYEFHYDPSNYYQSYGYYTMGEIDMLEFRNKPVLLYQKYFDNDYILYNNPAYMSLFNQYYENYLYYSPFISKALLDRTINEKPDYPTLFNEVGRDPKLTNARLRELVIIKNLIGFIDNEEFDQQNIIQLLEYIRTASSFDKHKELITSKLSQIEQSRKLLEECVFMDEKGHKAKLKQFIGKPVYLQIFQTDCINCIREMMIIKELNAKYGEKIQFVSLCADPRKSSYQEFVKQYGKQFDWPMLYFDSQYDWLWQQEVETMPDYIIFNASGGVQQRYAPAPGQGLPEYLQIHFPDEQEEDNNPLFQNRNKQ